MNPRNQDCKGLYLYGAGWFSRDENTLSMLTGQRKPHFCLSCPAMHPCQQEHEKRVREQAPQDVEMFERLLAEARRRGIPDALAVAVLGKEGHDPFATAAIENFKRGHAERGSPLIR